MKKRWFILALSLLTVVNLAAFSTLAYRHWCASCEKQACCAVAGETNLKARLGLSAEQAAAMDALRAEFAAAASARAEIMDQERIALTQELMKAQPDSIIITAILQRIGDSQALLQRHSVNHLLAQKKILTAEQQQKLFGLVLHSCAMNPSECINH